jgi:hypothetical protein
MFESRQHARAQIGAFLRLQIDPETCGTMLEEGMVDIRAAPECGDTRFGKLDLSERMFDKARMQARSAFCAQMRNETRFRCAGNRGARENGDRAGQVNLKVNHKKKLNLNHFHLLSKEDIN